MIEAQKELESRLAKDSFTPHMGLLLAYLDLFQKSQNNLNQMTRRHLDFYFQDILQIEKKAYVEDEAHLLIQLAKNVNQHEIKAGTLFKATKDSNGNDILYELTEDFIAGKDSIASIKSSFESNDIIHAAASNAMAVDGMDEPLPEEDPVWSPFKNQNFPYSQNGFCH